MIMKKTLLAAGAVLALSSSFTVNAAENDKPQYLSDWWHQSVNVVGSYHTRFGPQIRNDTYLEYAAMAYTALNCEGLARCDFFVEKGTGRVLINEINTFPGFTSISMYPKLMEHEGLPVPQLIDRLIALALERKEKQHG